MSVSVRAFLHCVEFHNENINVKFSILDDFLVGLQTQQVCGEIPPYALSSI